MEVGSCRCDRALARRRSRGPENGAAIPSREAVVPQVQGRERTLAGQGLRRPHERAGPRAASRNPGRRGSRAARPRCAPARGRRRHGRRVDRLVGREVPQAEGFLRTLHRDDPEAPRRVGARRAPARRRHGGRCRGLPRREVTGAGSRDAQPPSRLPRSGVHHGATGEAVRRSEPGCGRAETEGAASAARLPAHRGGRRRPRRAAGQVEVPVRDGDLHWDAQGRAARAAEGGRRLLGAAHNDPPVARPRDNQRQPRRCDPDRGGASPVPARGRRSISVRAGVPATRRRDVFAASSARADPAAGATPREHPHWLPPHLPAARVWVRRAGARRRCPPLPEMQDEALAGPAVPAAPVPRHAPHDGLAAHHGGRRPPGGPADHAAHRPAHHDGVLRAPLPGLPAERDRPSGDQPEDARRAAGRGFSYRFDAHEAGPEDGRPARVCCTLAAGFRKRRSQRARRLRKSATNRRLTWERDTGFEPATFSLGS